MRRVWIHGLFFASGASALAHELVWQRQLHLVLGVSTLAVSTALAAFMGGMALGGFALGRLADQTRRPLRLYALVEAGIGLAALILPIVFAWLTDWYASVHAWLQPGPWGGALLRFALAFPIVAGLAALIGGTFPLMGRLTLRPGRDAAGDFSLLYGINTLGAVVGAGLTGFVLLRVFGLEVTIRVAAGTNLLIAAFAAGTDWLKPSQIPSADRAVPLMTSDRMSTPRLALALAIVLGATGMGLEVVWSRMLGILTSNSAYGFALMLTVYLLGLALGGLMQTLWSRRTGDPRTRLALCQWALAAVTLATLPSFHNSPAWLDLCCDGGSTVAVFLGEAGLTALALLVPGILMGMSFPLIVTSVTQHTRQLGVDLGALYAVNSVGCVVGAFASGFVLIPRLGIQPTVGLVLAVTLAMGTAAWLRAASLRVAVRVTGAAAVVTVAIAAWFWLPHGGFSKSRIAEPRLLLYYREGNSATVSVVEEPNGIRNLLVDGQPVAGTGNTSVIDQKMLAHLPLLLHPAPHRALTVGFGSGGTSWSMGLHGVDVDCVEIEAAVPAAAEFFMSENNGVLAAPRYRLVLDDARSWLRVSPLHYDAIVTDCTNIQYRSNGDLYTVDYFRLLRDRLTPTGIAAAWVPANGIREADLKTLLRSFKAVFPHTSVWYMDSLATDFLIVVGTPGPLAIDMPTLARRMAAPAVLEDLTAIGLADPARLLYTFLLGDGRLDEYLGQGPTNTDDRPVLSYSTYGATFENTIPANLIGLVASREDVAPYVHGTAADGSMLRHLAASNEIILGHVHCQRGQPGAALPHYLKAAEYLPNDACMPRLIRSTLVQLHWSQPAEGVPLAAPMGN